MTLYLDLDGVLADFDAGYERQFGVKLDRRAYVENYVDRVDWKAMALTQDFYLSLPPIPDMRALWDGVAHLSPVILTAVPRSIPEAPWNKIAWVRKHLGVGVRVICTKGAGGKAEHCRPGDVLVDDYPKYRDRWLERGGVFVLHRTAAETLERLREVGVLGTETPA